MNTFAPLSNAELAARGWDACDIIIVSGDAYVDHPAWGVAVITRVLERAGFRVGIIAQPDWRDTPDFKKLGKPKLFFAVTGGNLDSMGANYTANKRPRKSDDYSPAGIPGRRPDRASIVYANRIRQAFPDSPIVLGGIEASLRRIAHYDYWDNAIRGSIIVDARADILVYGMGERQITTIARRLAEKKDLRGIPGTVIIQKNLDLSDEYLELPSYDEVKNDTKKFNEAFTVFYRNQDHLRGKTLVQKHASRFVVHFPPAAPLSSKELDNIFALPFTRRPHPVYAKSGGIPGFETVKFSIIANRGCCGECAFCSLYAHQGRIVQSRTKESVIAEARRMSAEANFKGTISDVGGPTANLYGAQCRLWGTQGACRDRGCLMPKPCRNLKLNRGQSRELYRTLRAIPGIKHVFIESGIRYDLCTGPDAAEYLEDICAHHISGQLKVAPEHSVARVLTLMNKPDFSVYERFAEQFKKAAARGRKELYLVHYFISAHPGATLADALALSLELMRRRARPEQIQDFIPLPLTVSACMFYSGRHPFTDEPVYVARDQKERSMQRALIQYFNPKNKRLVKEALKILGREDLWGTFQRAGSR